MVKVIPIPALKDNYIWLIKNGTEAIVVDPGDASPVLAYLSNHALTLTAILITHKHADHTGGIAKLLDVYPATPVYAHPKEAVTLATYAIQQDDNITFTHWPIIFNVIEIPGHTLGHVAYYANPMVFTGDTLFGAGCGRIFEGTPEQMLTSLNKLAALPNATQIYCGHEYTLANLHFAHHVEPTNATIKQRIATTQIPSLPSMLSLEKQTNPFLRCQEQGIIESVENHTQCKLTNIVDVFHALREWKNNFV